MDGEKATETTDTGTAKVKVEKIPTEEAVLKIKLSGSGMNDFTKVLNVKLEKGSASDLKVFFKSEDGDQEVVGGITPTFSTTKNEGTVTVKTTTAEMSKVMVGGTEATLSEDKKSATYKLSVTGTDTDPQEVKVEVEFPYFKKAERTFKVAKYGNKNDFPLRLISAKILSGDDYSNPNDLEFNSQNEVSKKIDDVQYSTVKLVMEFDQNVQNRLVKACKDERPSNYSYGAGEEDFKKAFSGLFSGYIVSDVDPKGKEKALEPINKKTYTEELIVGGGTVSYEIEITSDNGKKLTYTINIENIKEAFEGGKPNQANLMQEFSMFNGPSGVGSLYGYYNGFYLPYYNKSGNSKDSSGFNDLAYMENLNLHMSYNKADEDLRFYYNIMDEESGKAKDEHKFKRIIATEKNSKGGHELSFVRDLDGKYLDCFASGKKTLPNPMIPDYYGKKFRKTKTKHTWLLDLLSDKKLPFQGGDVPVQVIFKFIFNYRIQAMAYEKQITDTNHYLTISKKQNFKLWANDETIPGWGSFLTPADGNKTDAFFLSPPEGVSIKGVKYTIKKGTAKDNCVVEPSHNNVDCVKAKFQNGSTAYIPGATADTGGKITLYKLENNNVYKIDVTITYNAVGGGSEESDTFRYLIDYTDAEGMLESMDIADEEDADSNLFGVPTSYGMKTIDPAILKELANNSYTFIQGM